MIQSSSPINQGLSDLVNGAELSPAEDVEGVDLKGVAWEFLGVVCVRRLFLVSLRARRLLRRQHRVLLLRLLQALLHLCNFQFPPVELAGIGTLLHRFGRVDENPTNEPTPLHDEVAIAAGLKLAEAVVHEEGRTHKADHAEDCANYLSGTFRSELGPLLQADQSKERSWLT